VLPFAEAGLVGGGDVHGAVGRAVESAAVNLEGKGNGNLLSAAAAQHPAVLMRLPWLWGALDCR